MVLKGIEKVVALFTVETAVYWGNPQPDGEGGLTFDDPIEIAVRWDQKREVKVRGNGITYTSAGHILTNHEIEEDGCVYLGSLTDFDSTVDITNPKSISKVFSIIQLNKIPMVFKNDEFVRTGYLFDYGK